MDMLPIKSNRYSLIHFIIAFFASEHVRRACMGIRLLLYEVLPVSGSRITEVRKEGYQENNLKFRTDNCLKKMVRQLRQLNRINLIM
jgi:hypothetical protein